MKFIFINKLVFQIFKDVKISILNYYAERTKKKNC